ncbi:MAG: DUF4179 domain-containing protein [Clostridiaceae bacterium]|nr:DUF4179 domain-containing protein [Clostridiaceae bacterium]
MNCENIRNKLIDYIDETLTVEEEKIIKKHMKECIECREELEELQNTIEHVEREHSKVKVPEAFMDKLRADAKKANKPTVHHRRRFRRAIVLVAMMTLFIATAVATDGFGVLNWWRQLSIRESRSVYELLQEGYGDQVNLTAVDQDIKVTVESILADDIKTVLLLEIEDLKKEDLYGTTKNGIEFVGSFEYDEDIPEEFQRPNFSLMTLASDEPHKRKFLIRLQPLTEKESTLFLNINGLESNITDSDKVVEGNWNFEIPVSTYDITTYDIHKDLEVDDNILKLETLTVGPTATLLTYSYDHNQNQDYILEHFSNMRLFSNGKEYQSRFMGGDVTSEYSRNRKKSTRVTLEFDTIYLDEPSKVEIKVGGYEVHVKANTYASFDINMNKPFPQEFEYMDSKIVIEGIDIREDETEVILREPIEDRNYGNLEIDFRAEANSFFYALENWEEYYFIDGDGTIIEGKDDNHFYYSMNLENPIMYITKNRIILKHSPGSKNLPPEVRGPDEIVPTALVIRGYRETRRMEESIIIKLK